MSELAVAPVDMRGPAFRHDPHPLLREAHESNCVARDVLANWPVLHHVDVNAVPRSSQLSRGIWRSPGCGQTRPFLADGTMGRSDRLQTLGSVRLSASAIG